MPFTYLGIQIGQLLDIATCASFIPPLAAWACVKAAGEYAVCVRQMAERDFERWVGEWR